MDFDNFKRILTLNGGIFSNPPLRSGEAYPITYMDTLRPRRVSEGAEEGGYIFWVGGRCFRQKGRKWVV